MVGIGGSYLGARAAIEALASPSAPPCCMLVRICSASYHARLLDGAEGQRVRAERHLQVGEQPPNRLFAFRILREHLEARVGKACAAKRIVATSPTRARAHSARWQPSKATAPSWCPMMSVGGSRSFRGRPSPDRLRGHRRARDGAGAAACAEACRCTDLMRNPAYLYAVARNRLY